MDVSKRRVMMLRFTVFVFLLIHVNGQANNVGGNHRMNNAIINNNAPNKIGGNPSYSTAPVQTHHQPPMDPKKTSSAKPGSVKPPAIRLSETKECANDIIKHCNPKIYKNNFAILDCLQNDLKVNIHFNRIFHAELQENNDI